MPRVWTPRLFLLSLAHFTSDAYSSFLSPLLPLFVAKLHLSLSDVGALVALSSATSSLSQPLFGAWADRLRRPWFVAFGPLLTAVFMSVAGAAPSFTSLVLVVLTAGLGSAAFHPQAAALAGAEGQVRSKSMSMFVTGGTVGFMAGPLVAVAVATRLGLEHMWMVSIPGVVVGLALIAWFLRVPIAPHVHDRPKLSELLPVWRPLTLIYLCGVFRTIVSFGFMTFLSLYLHRLGLSVTAGGLVITAFVAGGAAGGLCGGLLAERWGGRQVLVLSFLVSLPLLVGFLLLPIGPGIVSLVLGGAALQSALPVNVTMGQELSPRHTSTVSSLLMGVAWGTGLLLVAPLGVFADHSGLKAALLLASSMSACGAITALALPQRRATLVAVGA